MKNPPNNEKPVRLPSKDTLLSFPDSWSAFTSWKVPNVNVGMQTTRAAVIVTTESERYSTETYLMEYSIAS